MLTANEIIEQVWTMRRNIRRLNLEVRCVYLSPDLVDILISDRNIYEYGLFRETILGHPCIEVRGKEHIGVEPIIK